MDRKRKLSTSKSSSYKAEREHRSYDCHVAKRGRYSAHFSQGMRGQSLPLTILENHSLHGGSFGTDHICYGTEYVAAKNPNEKDRKRKLSMVYSTTSGSSSCKTEENLFYGCHDAKRGRYTADTSQGMRGEQSQPVSAQETQCQALKQLSFHQILGEGSFGKVYLASVTPSRQQVAVKIVDKAATSDLNQSILREKKVFQMAVENRFLLHCHQTFQTEDHVCYVMEYVAGGDLREAIEDAATFDTNTTRFLAAEITCGLQYLHARGVIHRDLKPENILIDHSGHVKLADFGLAATDVFGNKISGWAGTLEYMAPEMICHQKYDTAIDWFSLGIICFEMITGYYPFYEGDDIDRLQKSLVQENPQYPSYLEHEEKNLLKKLLNKSPIRRNEFVTHIRMHPFFGDISWDDLESGTLESPLQVEQKPVNNPTVTIPLDDVLQLRDAREPLTAEQKLLIQGFSYITEEWRQHHMEPE